MRRRRSLGPTLLALAVAACQAPLGGADLELSAGPTVLPGAGVLLGISQRAWSGSGLRVDLEADYVVQRVDEEPTGDDYDQVRLGLRLRTTPEQEAHWALRTGVVFLRNEGDLPSPSGTGDFGGGYLGLGYEWRVGRHVRTGPDVSLLVVDSEGHGDNGVVPQLAWRWMFGL